ncbi:Disintegrin and metalloproteinase domain-containing protein 12 [Nymphon striatum]|nr:Disintegrin and metalloproteinase domain-containing protein 12 [Nymphon striatum]
MCPACTNVWVRDLGNYRYPVEKIGECPTQYGKKDPRDLFAHKYYEKHHDNGKPVTYNPTFEANPEGNICVDQAAKINHLSTRHPYYSGNGVVDDGREAYYIEPMKVNHTHATHYLVNQSSMKGRHLKCGKLHKRSLSEIRPPYSSNRYSRYVELILVSDKIEFEKFDKDKEILFSRSKQIGNIVNALYAPLGIYIALVGVVVWSDHDEIILSTNGDVTLTNFLRYRRERLIHERANDNAQLITGLIFDEGVVGKALKGPICTYEYSGGVNMDHSKVVGLVATTVAHELGHNFGMEHDESQCRCPASKCIMAPSSSSTRPSHWSSCSLEYLHLAYEQGMDYCLHNKPESLIGPVCGNGFLEDGEECDCGLKEHCNNYCCNPNTCKLYSNASCATGMCCDISTCQVKPIAVPCRESISECDLTEYCNGESEFCPEDTFIMDGTPCKDERAHCVKGKCNSHIDQCRKLWGPTGTTSDSRCYGQNEKGSVNGNCGYEIIHKNYTPCHKEQEVDDYTKKGIKYSSAHSKSTAILSVYNASDVMCGMLHCIHLTEKLEFGMESAAILARSFIRVGSGKVLTCRSAIVDLGIGVTDPGLAPDGAMCGKDKMCHNQKCVPVSDVKKTCPYDCYYNGVCNSNGNCHCVLGFGPPYCDTSGPGGSIDSGPASDPAAMYRFMVVMLVLFLGVVPILIFIGCISFVFRRHLRTWWLGKATRATVKSRKINVNGVKKDKRPVSKSGHSDRANLCKLEISSPIPCNGSVVPVPTTQLPTQSMLENNAVKKIEISNPVIQIATKNNTPVRPAPTRPAPPRPSVIPPPRTSSQGVNSQTKVVNNSKNDVSRASSLSCKEPGRRPTTRPPARPTCPPTLQPPPSYWEIINHQSGAKAENTVQKPDLDSVNSVKHNKALNTQNNLVAALTEKFEKSAPSVSADSSSKPASKNYLSNKNDKHHNAKC